VIEVSLLLFAVVVIVLVVNVPVLVVAVVMMVVIVICGAIYTKWIPISFSATQIFTYGLITDRMLMP
jgi:hypothetical protein